MVHFSEQQLSKHSVQLAVTSDQVLERHNVSFFGNAPIPKKGSNLLFTGCQSTETNPRDFYYSNAHKGESRVAYRMKNRAWNLATSDERGYISGPSVPNA